MSAVALAKVEAPSPTKAYGITASNCTPGLFRSQYSSAHSDSNRIIGRPSRSVALRVPAVDADIAAIFSAGPTTQRAALYGKESTSHWTLY